MADAQRQFWLTQKTVIENRIIEFNTVFNNAMLNPTRSYTLNTGQSTQSVSRDSIKDYQAMYDSLLNQYATICARLGMGGVIHQFSGW